ncbi:MAG: hypothetical protein WC455_11090 [Dehalococcoidia bacterium]|jgi:hypothetical protein
MEPVLSKKDFVLRYRASEFGNRAPTWNTLEEFIENRPWLYLGTEQRYHIRNRRAGGPTWYDVCFKKVPFKWSLAINSGEKVYISAMAPHYLNVLQGEVMEGVWGWEFYGARGCLGRPMREALRMRPMSRRGLEAKLLIQWSMNDLSYQWLEYLLEAYPGHVVEFSAFSTCWGTVPGHNSVVWEVRKY